MKNAILYFVCAVDEVRVDVRAVDVFLIDRRLLFAKFRKAARKIVAVTLLFYQLLRLALKIEKKKTHEQTVGRLQSAQLFY